MGLAVLFWLVFAIVIFGIFLFNREVIGNSVRIIQNQFALRNDREIPPLEPVPPPIIELPAPIQPAPVQPAPVQPIAQAQPEHAPPEQAPPEMPPQAVPGPQLVEPVTELRDRALYFTQVDRSGTILRVRVDRGLPVSISPLNDVLQALVTGPNEEERQRGLISLIPTGTQVLSAAIRDDTAYINFNEDFQFNTFGVEGYAAQLREVVFTVTEFPNIRDVQILIEGRRVDFLGEGIWIGSPLNREMF